MYVSVSYSKTTCIHIWSLLVNFPKLTGSLKVSKLRVSRCCCLMAMSCLFLKWLIGTNWCFGQMNDSYYRWAIFIVFILLPSCPWFNFKSPLKVLKFSNQNVQRPCQGTLLPLVINTNEVRIILCEKSRVFACVCFKYSDNNGNISAHCHNRQWLWLPLVLLCLYDDHENWIMIRYICDMWYFILDVTCTLVSVAKIELGSKIESRFWQIFCVNFDESLLWGNSTCYIAIWHTCK